MQGTFDLVEDLAGQSLRGLRKLGLHDQVAELLRRTAELVLQEMSLDELRQHLGADAGP